MMKKFAKIIALALVAVFVIALMCSCTTNPDKETTAESNKQNGEDKTYVIGSTGPLTGPASSYGISVQNGANLAIADINKNGGLNGVKFSFVMLDDEATPAKVTSAYDTLINQGVQASIGSVTTGSCLQFASLSKEDNLFFITPSASAADVIENSNGYRICFGDPDQGVLSADTLAKDYNNIGVIYNSDDAYSSGIYEAFEAEMGKLGKTFVSTSFTDSTKTSFQAQITTLKNSGCDVVFLPIYYQEAFLIVKEAKSQNYTVDFFGCDGLDGLVAYSGSESDIIDGIKYLTPFSAAGTDKNVVDFVAAYKAAYGNEPDQFAADGYDAVMVIYEAMKAAGVNDVNISASDLCDKITTVLNGDFTYAGLTGTMTWDESGASTKAPMIIEINTVD